MKSSLSKKLVAAIALLAGLQLSAGAFAKSVTAYMNEDGLSVSDAYSRAKADCQEDAACLAQIPKDLLAANVRATDIMIAAVASGADPAYVVKVFSKAAINAEIDLDRITRALLSITNVPGSGFTQSDVISGMSQAAEESNNSNYSVTAVIASARASGVSAATVISGLTSANVAESESTASLQEIYTTSEITEAQNQLQAAASGDDFDNVIDTTNNETVNEISTEITTGGNSLAGIIEA